MTLLDKATIYVKRVEMALKGFDYDPDCGDCLDCGDCDDKKISDERRDAIIIGTVKQLIWELKTANDCGRATDETVKHMFSHTPKILQEFYRLTLRNTLSEEGKNRKEWAHILCDDEDESHEESCADCEEEGE